MGKQQEMASLYRSSEGFTTDKFGDNFLRMQNRQKPGLWIFRLRLVQTDQGRHCLGMRSYFNLGQVMIFPKSAAEFGPHHMQT